MSLPIFEVFWRPSPVLVVMVEGAGVSLTTEAGRSLTRLCLVVGQHKTGLCESVVGVCRRDVMEM